MFNENFIFAVKIIESHIKQIVGWFEKRGLMEDQIAEKCTRGSQQVGLSHTIILHISLEENMWFDTKVLFANNYLCQLLL